MIKKPFRSSAVLVVIVVLVWKDDNGALAREECGSVVNNTLTSPGYPNNYPSRMDCNYSVPIPVGMKMIMDFQEFDLENHGSCRWDYLKITNEKNQSFGVHCGNKSGEDVVVSGNYSMITFHSDGYTEKKGFRIFFRMKKNQSISETIAMLYPPNVAADDFPVKTVNCTPYIPLNQWN